MNTSSTLEPEVGSDVVRAAAARGTLMKAIVQDAYGPPDILSVREIPRPAIGPGDALVRVHAAGLNLGDCFGVRGEPLPMRLETGLFRPRPGIPGRDLAGVIESVGSQVEKFRVGDAVFGAGRGTCAEYASVPQERLAPMPTNLSFEQAAAVPTAGLVALHGLRDAGRLKPGQRVLINGASGGVGSFAVQIAKVLGAEVTGVCSTPNVEVVRSLGADHVVDYTRDDFASGKNVYDLVLDNVENRSLSDCRRALTRTGTLVLNSGSGARGLALMVRLLKPLALSPFVRHRLVRYLSKPDYVDLMVLKDLVESGRLKPVIDRAYPQSETVMALRHVESGHARGKVVVHVNGGGGSGGHWQR